MTYAYARVSTKEQNEARQIAAFEQAEKDVASGVVSCRKAAEMCGMSVTTFHRLIKKDRIVIKDKTTL